MPLTHSLRFTHLLNGSLNAMGLPLLKTDGKPNPRTRVTTCSSTPTPISPYRAASRRACSRRGRAPPAVPRPPGYRAKAAWHATWRASWTCRCRSSRLPACCPPTWAKPNAIWPRRSQRAEERDDALLLIDEIDSLLQQRQSAVRNWEVSQVNELLLQTGALQRSSLWPPPTDLQALDPAALRRFDLKLGFARPATGASKVLVFLEGLRPECLRTVSCPQALQALALQAAFQLSWPT